MVYKYNKRGVQIVVDDNRSKLNDKKCSQYPDATHVITEVTYGYNAYMVFELETSSVLKKKSIYGSLHVLVKSMPQFSIEGSASLNLTEEEKVVKNRLSFKYFGDSVIDPPPATFADAIKVNLLLNKTFVKQTCKT